MANSTRTDAVLDAIVAQLTAKITGTGQYNYLLKKADRDIKNIVDAKSFIANKLPAVIVMEGNESKVRQQTFPSYNNFDYVTTLTVHLYAVIITNLTTSPSKAMQNFIADIRAAHQYDERFAVTGVAHSSIVSVQPNPFDINEPYRDALITLEVVFDD